MSNAIKMVPDTILKVSLGRGTTFTYHSKGSGIVYGSNDVSLDWVKIVEFTGEQDTVVLKHSWALLKYESADSDGFVAISQG